MSACTCPDTWDCPRCVYPCEFRGEGGIAIRLVREALRPVAPQGSACADRAETVEETHARWAAAPQEPKPSEEPQPKRPTDLDVRAAAEKP